ncbi:MAG: 2-succinyl-5-enolpyruvyl-6-hydroxy-3-cyclohexene-carboxylic-acid synthase, partial [Actinomycetota bacterium]
DTIGDMSSLGDTSATFCATLVDEWVRLGVQHAVVAPGSRSTPLAVALAARSEISLHIFHDERSASFAALGAALVSNVPSILLCTSGTAAAHFLAAVIEADLSGVPMIVCTADRPPEMRDVGAPQTINQVHLYGGSVRWFHDPGVPSDDASHTWRSLASRAYSSTLGERPGPVHVNLPFREPLLGAPSDLPPARQGGWSQRIRPVAVSLEGLDNFVERLSGRTGIIVAGKGSGRDVLALAAALGWPVFADPVSGVRECDPLVSTAFDPILRNAQFADAHQPEVVLRIGAPPASKVLSQWVSRSGAEVLQICSTDSVTDPEHNVSVSLVSDVALLVRDLAVRVKSCHPKWISDWSRAETAAQVAIGEWTDIHMSEPTVARIVTASMKVGAHLVVSSSMPIRDVEWFGTVTPGVTVHSNRGANGIDGVISTAVGVAIASNAPVTLLIGDVATVHDSNGLWALARRGVNLTIVVTNNDGGSIFSFLPQATQVEASTFELLYGTPHGVSFEHLAAAHGIAFHRASTAGELRALLGVDGVRMIEVPLDRSVNVSQHNELNDAVIQAISATDE